MRSTGQAAGQTGASPSACRPDSGSREMAPDQASHLARSEGGIAYGVSQVCSPLTTVSLSTVMVELGQLMNDPITLESS